MKVDKDYWIKFFVLFFTYGLIKRYFGFTLFNNGWIEAVVSGLYIAGVLRIIKKR